MSTMRNLTFGALSLLTLATAVGCGQPGAMMAPVGGIDQNGFAPATVEVQGVTRRLGYDWNHYQKDLAPKAHPKHSTRQGMLPGSVDLRSEQAPVYDQGQLGACTAFSIGKGFREWLERKSGEGSTPLSAMFFYYAERDAQGTVTQDSGATITEGFKVLQDTGIAPDKDCPYNIAQFKEKPSAAAYKDAAKFKIHSATQLAGLDDVKGALASGQSVAFGFLVHRSFMNIGSDGMMPMPGKSDKVEGGHAVLAVGYDDAKKALIVRNSWGTSWGDKGYFYMPYAYVTKKNTDDFWTGK